jgi:hypothetical protein
MAGFWTTQKESRLREFWSTDFPLRVLAEEISTSEGYISQRAKLLGLPSRATRGVSIRIKGYKKSWEGQLEGRRYMEVEAGRRGISVSKLETLLIKVIANERLVAAVMDDVNQMPMTISTVA